MKTFAVYSNVLLPHAPAWLVDFRKKYDEPWEPHITLKQPCFIEDADIDAMKAAVRGLFPKKEEARHDMRLVFDTVVEHTDADGTTCIMIRTNSPELHALQKRIVEALRAYRLYIEPELEDYEKNFLPHITIGRNLDAEKRARARHDLPDDIRCDGVIADVTLSVVEGGLSPEQTMATQERSIFSIG